MLPTVPWYIMLGWKALEHLAEACNIHMPLAGSIQAARCATRADNTILHDFPPPELEVRWRDFLTRVDCPSHYNAPEFFREPYWAGKRPFAILAWGQGEIVGVLTGIHEGDEVESGQQSRPQVCLAREADPVAAGDALARGLLSEAGRAKVISVYAWSWTPLEPFKRHGFRFRQMEGDVILDLKQGADALFKQFDENRRRNIRLAARKGVEVFPASTREDVSAYYQIRAAWRQTPRKRIRGSEPPIEQLQQRYRLTGNFRLFLARHSGKMIAGITLRFLPGGLLEYANGAAVEEFLHLRPNDLLQWRAIEWACAEGFRSYSLGGAHPFLSKFGGEVVPVYRYRLDRTLLHRHDLREAVLDKGRVGLRKMPRPFENAVRRLLGRPAVNKETDPHGRGGK